MSGRFTGIACSILAAAACASATTGTPVASVPVYDAAADIPCQYEVIRTVRGESSALTGGSPANFERERTRVLGQAGARVGADAVLVPDMTDAVGVQRRATAPIGAAPNLTFEGEAIRFLTGTCRDGR